MKKVFGFLLRSYLYLHERLHERVFHSLAIRYFDGLHPKNIFHFRSEFFQENVNLDDVIIDIACGTGRILHEIHSDIKKGIGIDYDESNISLCKNKFKEKNLEFIQADILSYPYSELKDQIKYNKAIFSHILEHIEDVPALLKKVSAAQILICVPCQENWYRQTLKAMHLRYTTDPTHFREYTRAQLKSEITEAGYQIDFIGFNSEGEIVCKAHRTL